jgi:hypothetical protein
MSYRLIFLGAGFSRPAGLPLGKELFNEVRRLAAAALGKRNHLEEDLVAYQQFRMDCDGLQVALEDIEFEEFLAHLDLEHFLGLRGSDTWSDQGNESQLIVKQYIGQVLWAGCPEASGMPRVYLDFAAELQPNDWVLSFNYDVLLERALERIGKPYRLFPQRFAQIGSTYNTIDSRKEEVVLLKLHGSIDWFDRSSYEERLEVANDSQVPYVPRDPIFGADPIVAIQPLVDGPRNDGDPLARLWRARSLDAIYGRDDPAAVPFLLSPSMAKFVYLQKLRDLWYGLGQAGGWNLSVVIIGYSLPAYDQYAKQALYNVVTNFSLVNPELEFGGRRKTKVRVVDFRPTEDSRRLLHETYRFLTPDNSEFWYEGLNEDAVRWALR